MRLIYVPSASGQTLVNVDQVCSAFVRGGTVRIILAGGNYVDTSMSLEDLKSAMEEFDQSPC